MVFTSGQGTGDMQCISISIVDDDNVLEVPVETFKVMLTSLDSIVTFPLGQESATITINEDTMDGRYLSLNSTVLVRNIEDIFIPK